MKIRKRYYAAGLFVVLVLLYYWSLPEKLFNDPCSAVLEDNKGELLSASIAADGQWRFPEIAHVPEKFAKALVTYEDKRFWNHPGVDVLSLARAFRQNIEAGEIVSGGSTISMQVIRLSRKGRGRTVIEKCIESALATRLEVRYTKDEILALYASHAPFGGNVVGLEAACWRYFGREPENLSWAEAALLAVLPNAPSLIHPGKNRDELVRKRNSLLTKMLEQRIIDQFTYELALTEPIADKPHPLPRYARHLLDRSVKENSSGNRIATTLELPLQQRVEQILDDHHKRLKGNQIYNACALVIEVETGKVLAYAGNVNTEEEHGRDVDVLVSPRSTGSILKPFLYAAMLEDGKILPKTLLPDVPTLINGFAPKNFTKEYDGAVAADKALTRSLNVPAVHMLRDYRYDRFHELLKNMGMKSLTKPADHYGLSLILGGAEGTLWEVTGMYASMARTLNHYFNYPGKNRYIRSDFHEPFYRKEQRESTRNIPPLEEATWLSASAIYQTFEALKEVYRPEEESGWRYFTTSKKIAWKTGTSFGFRDGWAVGVTPQYAVGVWVGNADGEGRPGLTGTEAAAPVLFDIFSQLPGNAWFRQPQPEMEKVQVCQVSGMRLSEYCVKPDTVWISRSGLQTATCNFHKVVHLSRDKKYRVHSECETVDQMEHAKWFILPPIQEYYFRQKNVTYKPLPPVRYDCTDPVVVATMDLIYPKPNARIFIPRELDGRPGSSVFELAHRNPGSKVYWHLDGQFIGETCKTHQIAVNPASGAHILTLVDEAGVTLKRHFEVISK